MEKLYELLESKYPNNGGSFQIIETSFALTYDLAKWVSSHRKATFSSIGMNWEKQHTIHAELEKDGLARYCTFHMQEPIKFLNMAKWIDVAALNPVDLSDGKQQFILAASSGASVVIIPDHDTKAALAVELAQSLHWKFYPEGNFCTLERSW